MSFDGGGVENRNKTLRVCVARTVSGKGGMGGCIELIEGMGCACTILCVYVLLGGSSGVEGTVCMCCSKSSLGIEPHSDSSDKESETVSHDGVSSSQ